MRGGKLAFRAQICVACKYVLSRQPRRFLIPLDCTTDIELSRELLYTRQGDFSHPELHQRAQETCPHQPRGTKPGEAVFWSQGRLSNKHLMVWVKKKKEVVIDKLEKGGGGGLGGGIMSEVEQFRGALRGEGNLSCQCADSYLHVN